MTLEFNKKMADLLSPPTRAALKLSIDWCARTAFFISVNPNDRLDTIKNCYTFRQQWQTIASKLCTSTNNLFDQIDTSYHTKDSEVSESFTEHFLNSVVDMILLSNHREDLCNKYTLKCGDPLPQFCSKDFMTFHDSLRGSIEDLNSWVQDLI